MLVKTRGHAVCVEVMDFLIPDVTFVKWRGHAVM